MNTKSDIDAFFSSKTIALVGLSRDPLAFSHLALKQLKVGGFKVYPVNPHASEIQGEACWPSLAALPEKPEAAYFCAAPEVTASEVKKAVGEGVKRIWIQQGAQSPESEALCRTAQTAVSGKCLMMFAPPVQGMHKFHRVLAGVFGGLPK